MIINFLHNFILIIKVAKVRDDITDFTKDIPTFLYAVQIHAANVLKCFSSCLKCHSINSNLDTKICRNNRKQCFYLQF